MKTLIGLGALVLAAATACSGSDATVATDPAPTSSAAAAMPSTAPSSPGPVSTRGPVTVIDKGDGAQLCLGASVAIYPPSCGGPAITNWDWSTFGQDMGEQQDTLRWGSYFVTGTWDGSALTVEMTIPAALYDAAVPGPFATPPPTTAYSADELDAIAQQLGADLPGAQGGYVAEGHAVVDVTYDDGSLQAWSDQEYGASVVLVSSALVDAG